MKIEEYKTASGYTVLGLDKNVNQLVKDGFQPFGAPYCASGQPGKAADSAFCQAMVRFAKTEDAEFKITGTTIA